MLKNLSVILFVALLFIGCKQKQKRFTHTYQKSLIGTKISTIKLINTNDTIKDITQCAFQNSKFTIKENAKFNIKIDYSKYPKTCNNPLVTADEKNYIGFIKLTLLQNDKKVYMCQIDFKKDLDIQMIEDLIDLLIEEMQLKVY